MAMVDTVVMVDTMVDTVDTEARGPLMPNPRLRLMPLLNPKLMLMPGDTTVILMLMDTDTTDIPTVISAKDLLMPNLRLRLMLGGTDTADTMVDTTAVLMDTVTTEEKGPLKLNPSPTTDTDTVDTIMAELLKTPLKLPSGSSHSISFNLATIP